MPDGDRRVRIVCEDRRTERLLSKVCQRKNVGVLHVEIAPAGKGSAFTWIQRRYPEFVKLHRSKNYQRNLCLLVAIDGDNKGVAVRKLELEQALIEDKVEARKADERVAVFVPTWSIETWLASLVGASTNDESLPLKEDDTVRHLWQDDQSETQTITKAASQWRAGPPLLSSLADAYTEGQRIGV